MATKTQNKPKATVTKGNDKPPEGAKAKVVEAKPDTKKVIKHDQEAEEASAQELVNSLTDDEEVEEGDEEEEEDEEEVTGEVLPEDEDDEGGNEEQNQAPVTDAPKKRGWPKGVPRKGYVAKPQQNQHRRGRRPDPYISKIEEILTKHNRGVRIVDAMRRLAPDDDLVERSASLMVKYLESVSEEIVVALKESHKPKPPTTES